MFLKYLAGAALLTGSAAAACPVAADLAGGIRVTETDGVVHIFRAAGGGVVTVDSDYQDGAVGKNQLARGVYVLRLAVEEDGVLDFGSVFQTDYGVDPGNLTLPKPRLRQTLDTTVTTTSETYAERQEQTWGSIDTYLIGECRYDGLEGTITYTNDVETFVETILYLPAAGIGLLTSYTIQGEPTESYGFVSIAALK